MELGVDAGAEGEGVGVVGRHAAAEVVRLAEREQGVEVLPADAHDEPPDCRVGQARVHREHVVADKQDHLLGGGPRVAEPAQQVAGDRGARRLVVREAAVGEGRGLADVMDERRQTDDGPLRRSGVDGAQRVVPQVLARDLALREAALGGEVGRDDREQAGGLGDPQPRGRARRGEQLLELRADALPGQVAHELGVGGDRREGGGVDPELERRGQTDRADHAERVLAEPRVGVAHRAEGVRREVRPTAERVDQRVAVLRPARGPRPWR